MAGAACKTIINQSLRAVVVAVETILLDPNVHQNRLDEQERLDLIQRLADIDIATYTGKFMPEGGVRGILFKLQERGLVTDEIWAVLSGVDSTVSNRKGNNR